MNFNNGAKLISKNLILYIAIVSPIFCGFGTIVANIVSIFQIFAMIYYFKSEIFWLLVPVYFIYYSPLTLIGSSISIFNIFSALCIFRWILIDRKIKIKKRAAIIIFPLIMIYASFVSFINVSFWVGTSMVIHTLAIFYTIVSIQNNRNIREHFKKIFIFMCISGALYGIFFQNIKGIYELQDGIIQYSGRYSGTTGDPNYMAFFYCIALSYLVFIQTNKVLLKIVILFFLVVAIILTGSLTALLTTFIIMVFYVFFFQEKKFSHKLFISFYIVLSFLSFIVIINNDINLPLLNLLNYRIDEKILFLKIGDISGFTTGRSQYSSLYLNYLLNQNLFRIFFGGYQINSSGLVGNAFDQINYAAHNSYIDVLMTSGLVGLSTFSYAILSNILIYIRISISTSQIEDLAHAVSIIVAAMFVSGLSIFPSVIYLFFLFL